MSGHQLQITDVSLTDGQTVVWEGALDNSMLLAPTDAFADSGLAAIEVLSPEVIAQCIARDEHPLHRVELARRHYGTVPLRATVNVLTGHGRRSADILGPDALGAWLPALATAGISQVVLIDPLQDLARLEAALGQAAAAGLTTIATLLYSCDDDATDEDYAQRATALAAAGADRVMLRDESGILTPDRAHTLLPALVAVLGTIPLDLHTRCQTALGTVNAMEAGGLGVRGLDTALPTLANGASLPASTSVIRALSAAGEGEGLPNLGRLQAADARLSAIADQEGLASAAPWPFDLATYVHQLPGEVAAQFREQLREHGRWADLHEFATECAVIRAEMGSPAMVAPFARAIAEQAMGHLGGEDRYESLRPVLRRLIQGAYGVPGQVRTDLQAKVGALPAGSHDVPADEAGDEDLLLAWVAGVPATAVPRWPDAATPAYEVLTPHEALSRGLLERAGRYAELSVQAPGVRIHLEQEG